MQLRRTKAPQTPSAMLDSARQAQQDHRIAIAEANAKLVDTHNSIYNEAEDRVVAISEQVNLLQAEANGLRSVQAEVAATSAQAA